MSIEDNGGLRVLAINILGRFLSNCDNNIRFISFSFITLMVATWIGQNQKIRLMVVEINLRGDGAERLRERGRAKAPE
ncbi:hypothetical protein D0Y65_014165 [Glycine soja]|uniref:Uncharacterized protein n=2 Tax=Glycine subgen. Soja TaxID=1462606 RepID=K7KU20_SOYBN|nr:hypothetical protein D0Y65_014165 [Glycine soja]